MSYSVSTGYNGAVVHVSPVSGYSYYQIYWRKTSETTAETSGWIQGAPAGYVITGLEPNTSYTFNVGYNNTGTGGADGFMGAIEKSTQAAPTSNAYVRTGGVWKSAQAYVYTNGSWKPATPNIRSGGVWHG
jgi:hypothetical protein